MIASLTGILKEKNPTEILLDVNGVGYSISIPISTYSKIGEINSTVTILTYLHVREDAMILFGFLTSEERNIFKLLISVSGIGPKIALGILSGINVADLKIYIAEANINALTTIPGIGKKTAERLVLELREKVGKLQLDSELANIIRSGSAETRNDALQALTSLGFNQQAAEKAIRQVLKDADGKELSLEEIIKRALRITHT